MPKAKNAPLEKAAPNDAMKAAAYFCYGEIGSKAIVRVRYIQFISLDLMERLESAAESFRRRGRREANRGLIALREIFSLARDVHNGDSKSLRAVADAIDFERARPGGKLDPFHYWLCTTYAALHADLADAAGVPADMPRIKGWKTIKVLGRKHKIPVFDSDGDWGRFPFDPGPGLRPSFRDVLARLRTVPELKSFFADKLNPRRRIYAAAKALGMKFGGKVGRPRK
jgi:hypothetical protein